MTPAEVGGQKAQYLIRSEPKCPDLTETPDSS